MSFLALKTIRAPEIEIQDAHKKLTVAALEAREGQRIQKGECVAHVSVGERAIEVISLFTGTIKTIFVEKAERVSQGAPLMAIEVFELPDYKPDGDEFKPKTELGEDGRRGYERLHQKVHGIGYAAELFDAATKHEHGGMSALKENPLTRKMKEGVPPKMKANAAQNDQAVEQAKNDPNLQPSKQLEQRLGLTAQPSAAPTPSPLGK